MITAEQKLYNAIKDSIILEEGVNFLKLSETDQHNIILSVIQNLIQKQLKRESD